MGCCLTFNIDDELTMHMHIAWILTPELLYPK